MNEPTDRWNGGSVNWYAVVYHYEVAFICMVLAVVVPYAVLFRLPAALGAFGGWLGLLLVCGVSVRLPYIFFRCLAAGWELQTTGTIVTPYLRVPPRVNMLCVGAGALVCLWSALEPMQNADIVMAVAWIATSLLLVQIMACGLLWGRFERQRLWLHASPPKLRSKRDCN